MENQQIYLIAISLPLVYLFNRIVDLVELYCKKWKKGIYFVIVLFAITLNVIYIFLQLSNFFLFIWNGLFIIVFPIMIWWNQKTNKILRFDINEYTEMERKSKFLLSINAILGILIFFIPQIPLFTSFVSTLSKPELVISNIIYKCIGVSYIVKYIIEKTKINSKAI